jgi:2-polyprenyl-3-methyl-5-hydroxy-6-metoxy-1,4-benzoquinol methylase
LCKQYESADYYTVSLTNKAEIERDWGFRWRYLLRKATALVHRPHLLDVGAGNGYFVYLARKEFDLDATGIEISSNEIRYAKEMFGVELKNLDLDASERGYDVVTCFNGLRSLTSPFACFTACDTGVATSHMRILGRTKLLSPLRGPPVLRLPAY